MTAATILLPDTITESDARLLLAIKLFEVERLSCGKAAEMAGLSSNYLSRCRNVPLRGKAREWV